MMKQAINSIFKTFFLSLVLIAQVNFAYAQTASILPPAKTTFFDQNGKPLTGGKVKFYIPGTTVPKTTWQDSGETIPNTNPVILDSAGRGIILGDGVYRQQVFDKNNNLIWDLNTSSSGSGGGGGGSATVGDGDLVGTVKPWAGFVAPPQYVFAFGQTLTRAGFPLAFATLTTTQNVSCTSGNPTISGLSDTTQIPIGAPIESTCFNAGAVVVSTTLSTVTASANAIISANSSATFFPYLNGDGSLTFTLPDLRGRVVAGRDNMGGIPANRLTSATVGFGSLPTLGASGGLQSTILLTLNLPPYTPSGGVTITDPGHTHGVGVGPFGPSTSSFLAITTSTITSTLAGGTNGVQSSFTGITAVFGGAAQGGTSNPFPRIQPTLILNYIIKVLPDTNANSFFGVASIGGMQGVLNCGPGLICGSNTISAITTSGAGGFNTQVQYNNAGALGGIAGATTDGTTITLISPIINTGLTLGFLTGSTQCVQVNSSGVVSGTGAVCGGGGGGSTIIQRVITAAGAVTVTSTDNQILINKTTPATTTINLPAASTRSNLPLVIKDMAGNCATFTITIVPNGSENIEGAATLTMTINKQSFTLVPVASVGWEII